MEIKLGPAGIPIACKVNDSIEGVRTVSRLNLQAMEIEFVRGVHMSLKKAKELGRVASNLNISLSIHAPYFINLASEDKEKLKASKKRIYDTLERAHLMNARIIAVHAGYYGKDKEKASEEIVSNIKRIVDVRDEHGWRPLIGLETMGKQGQWGTLDEIIDVCNKFKVCAPVIDFGHVFARNAGHIDYGEIFDKLKVLDLRNIHSHFEGMRYSVVGLNRGNERWHMPLRIAKPDFVELAKEILKRKINITIICESPLLEKDSLYMKSVFENLGHKV